MRIVMVGTGYVGLVSGACFSEFGWDVVCIDKDAAKIARLEKGEMPIYEPGLDDLVARNVAAGHLTFGTELGPAVADADAVFLAVGPPARRGDRPDRRSAVMGKQVAVRVVLGELSRSKKKTQKHQNT